MKHDKPKVTIDFDEYIQLRMKAGLTTDSVSFIKADDLIIMIKDELSDEIISKSFNARLGHLSYNQRELIKSAYVGSSISMRDRIMQLIIDNSKTQ